MKRRPTTKELANDRKKRSRANSALRRQEQNRDTTARAGVRLDLEIRREEQDRDTTARASVRLDPEIRREEQDRDTTARTSVRLDPEMRREEQHRDTTARAGVRLDPETKKEEQDRNTAARASVRLDPEIRRQEQELENLSKRSGRMTFLSSWERVLHEFQQRTKEGPTLVCCCCGGLFFLKSTQSVTVEILLTSGCSRDFLCKVLNLWNGLQTKILLCSTCRSGILNLKVPKLSLSNGLAFPNIPHELQGLTQLEERLTAPRLPYMMLRPLGWDRQMGLKKNIVNVPIDVNETEKILPRTISNSGVVHLALMRRLEYKQPYMFETIRPMKVYEACKYLVTTPLYMESGITLTDDWQNRTEPVPFDENNLSIQEEDPEAGMEVDYAEDLNARETINSDESEINVSGEPQNMDFPSHSEETMLISDADLLSHAIKYAPGQSKKPISLLWDLNAEVLSFPTIYCGQKREVSEQLSYTDIAKSEARRYDRRACLPHKLLYSFKKSQMQQVVDSVTVSLRKKSNVQNVTAGNLLNNEYLCNMQQRNDGLIVLQNIRSSPVYWEARKKEVFATIRQLGMPTFFHTVSAMECQWPELLVILKKILDGANITELQAASLTQLEKVELIRRDPITCARYFDSKTHEYFSLILKSGAVFVDHPLEDYFMRVEFQHRGSPHLHIFLWLKGAPTFNLNPNSCIPFIDTYITTERTELSLGFQQHRHTHCCRRLVNGVHICRFGIPYPPMYETQICVPFPQDYPTGKKLTAKQNLAKIKCELERLRKDDFPEYSYVEFLDLLELSQEDYIEAIRSNIRRPTVFLKREINASFINAYNTKLLSAWRSNIDLQYITDAYACAKYLSSYINKAYRGMSTLLRKTATEMEGGNMAVKAKLKSLGSLFLNKSEVSAQEAAYGILGLEFSRFSRDHIFINTGPFDKRVLLTKPRQALEALPEYDTNIVVAGVIDHYSECSIELETTCLADYAALFCRSTLVGH